MRRKRTERFLPLRNLKTKKKRDTQMKNETKNVEKKNEIKTEVRMGDVTKELVLPGVATPNKGKFVIQIETSEGVRYTGPGKDWLVRDFEKAQIYKTRNGAERWVAKFAKAQGKTEILIV